MGGGVPWFRGTAIIAADSKRRIVPFQRREKDIQDANTEIHDIGVALTNLEAKVFETMTNLGVSIVMPQGQVEIEVEPGQLVENYNTCLLINRKQIEGLNAMVLQLSDEKIKHMELIKSYKRRFKMLEWQVAVLFKLTWSAWYLS